MQEDSIREPVELIDEDLDVIAGGLNVSNELNIGIALNLNIAAVDQLVEQIQVLTSNTVAAATNITTVSQ
ncbi:MAG: hypothetical protein JOZ17_09040 [Acetobacteraceae bacterium]|nr:hypothetical protein [Acetobacteraceae bacterium]